MTLSNPTPSTLNQGMATQDVPVAETLMFPELETIDSWFANIFSSLIKFKEHCAGLTVSLQNELDAMLGYPLQNDPYGLIYQDEHQYNPHLFLRICFFLAKVSHPALECWVDFQRVGFSSYLVPQTPEVNVVDVAICQARPPGYSIMMQLRLLEGTQVLEPPEWLSTQPLPIPPYSILDFPDLHCAAPADLLNKSQVSLSSIFNVDSFDTRGSFDSSGKAEAGNLAAAALSRTPTIQDLNKPSSAFSQSQLNRSASMNGGLSRVPTILDIMPSSSTISGSSGSDKTKSGSSAPLSRTPTIQDLKKSSSSYSQSQLNRSASVNSGLSHVPTILNIIPSNSTKSSDSLVRASSVRAMASFVRSGGDGLQRSDTLRTILESDKDTARVSESRNRLGSNLSRDSGWGVQPSQEDRRRPLRNNSVEEHRVPRLESLHPLTRSEEKLMDPVSDGKHNQNQESPEMGMDVDSK